MAPVVLLTRCVCDAAVRCHKAEDATLQYNGQHPDRVVTLHTTGEQPLRLSALRAAGNDSPRLAEPGGESLHAPVPCSPPSRSLHFTVTFSPLASSTLSSLSRMMQPLLKFSAGIVSEVLSWY